MNNNKYQKRKLILLGARKFIDMPVGTIYIPISTNSSEQCFDIIDTFKMKPLDLLDFTDMEIYGDNSGSLTFITPDADYEDYRHWYDANVVGDASPTTTLYLVLDESWLPDIGKYSEDQTMYTIGSFSKSVEINPGITLTKEQVLQTRKEFMEMFASHDNINNHNHDWARKTLEEYSDASDIDNIIVNLNLEWVED